MMYWWLSLVKALNGPNRWAWTFHPNSIVMGYKQWSKTNAGLTSADHIYMQVCLIYKYVLVWVCAVCVCVYYSNIIYKPMNHKNETTIVRYKKTCSVVLSLQTNCCFARVPEPHHYGAQFLANWVVFHPWSCHFASISILVSIRLNLRMWRGRRAACQ